MVNKREKTRSLVYQMKEDIFRQESALAELEGEELTAEQMAETKITPLPKFCHHSTGTVYDCPEDILRMAWLFEERGQLLDRNSLSASLQKTSTPLHSKTRLASDVSPTRSRRNQQNTRPTPAQDGLASSPAASRSPIQQLVRDKMEGLESAGWAARSSEVKTDSVSDDQDEANNETTVMPPIISQKTDTVTVSGAVSPTLTPSCGQQLDRKSLSASLQQKTSTPLHSKRRLKSDVSPTRSRRNRQNTQPAQADIDGPAASRSPIQQLVHDKMVGLESAGWAACSSEVKTDSVSDDQDEANNETTVMPPISSQKTDTVTVSGAVSPTLTPSCNGIVKTLNAADNRKRSDDDKDRENKSFGIVQMPLTGATLSDASDTVPADAAAVDSYVMPDVDISKNDLASNDSRVITSHADKVCASSQNDRIKTKTVDSETAKVKATKSGRRSADKTCPDTVKKDSLKASRASEKDVDTVPQIQTRRRASKEQLNHTTDELNSSLFQKAGVTRSARKTRSGEQLDDSSGIVTKQPTPSKSENSKRPRSSSTSRPRNAKSRENDKVCMQGASGSKSDIGLQQESSENELHKETAGKELKAPLQDSSALNHNTLTESTSQQIGSKDVETTDSASLTKHVPSDSESSNRPYFHSDNFTLIEVDRSKSVDDQNQSTTGLHSVKDEVTSSHEPVTLEPIYTDDGISVNDTQLVDSDDSKILKPVNSPKHKESENLLDIDHDILSPRTPASKPENVKKPTSSVPVKKPTSSARRSRLKTRVHGTDAAKELCDDAEKDDVVKEDGAKKKSAGRPRRKINSISMDAVSVGENSESHTKNQTFDDAAFRDRNFALTLDNKEESTTHMSATKLVTEPIDSVSSVASAATDNHIELSSSGVFRADDFLSAVTNLGRSDVTHVDNVQSSLKSTERDYLKSPKNHAPDIVKSDNLCSTKADIHNDRTGSTLSAKDGWKSILNAVRSQPSELGKMSTTSSRKRAAHLMAGCRHRTVGVKRPPPTIEETVSDRHMEIDINDQPLASEYLSIETNSNIDSDRPIQPHMPKHAPFVRTESSTSNVAENLTESSDQFFRMTPTAEINSNYVTQLNSSSTGDINEEVMKSKLTPQHSPPLANYSFWKDEKNHFCERPQIVRHDSVGSDHSGSLHGNAESKPLSSPTVVVDSRRESLRADLLRKFLPSKLIVSDSIKRRVQDGLQLLQSIRSASTICSHTRQKLADYLNQSRKEEEVPERLPLRPIDDKLDQPTAPLRRRLPVRPRRRVYSEWEYVSGDELTSPVSDAETNSDSDYSVDFEDLAMSEASAKSSPSLVRNREHRISTVHH